MKIIFLPLNLVKENLRMGRNVNREEVFRLEKEEALKDNLGNLKGDFLTEYIHPEVDTKANLQLKTLFSFQAIKELKKPPPMNKKKK
ncbi:hypothetical protein RCL_jg12808.t1 [Rhizophagus clarus]|uniref:Uncharacterized protein n=1 Tax=Rhizophagus clarus TaxID=94130 RepID=A0A8H3KXB0_9GLOM|nr:hypothetical protein RCL_jg12808.t1 [Rhizophagus clarus]